MARFAKLKHSARLASMIGLAILMAPSAAAVAQTPIASTAPTYADLADLAGSATSVVRVKIRKQAELPPERAPGVRPGHTRLYIEADTIGLLVGNPVGSRLRYLVDLPLTSKGKAPKLKKREMLVFARTVAGRPDEIRLVAPDAQLAWSEDLEARLRPILAATIAPDSPPVVTEIRDALSVPGNLAGESETQIFLDTSDFRPVSISVIRRPGMTPMWGVSWSEIVDQAMRPPQRDTLEWYRLACFLPDSLPAAAILAGDSQSRARAGADYRYVLGQLGACPRNRS